MFSPSFAFCQELNANTASLIKALHFKLAIDVDQESGADAQCHYMPQLDPNRDRALIAVLPEFLTDEISFPQSQAGKFYARGLKALNETPAPN